MAEEDTQTKQIRTLNIPPTLPTFAEFVAEAQKVLVEDGCHIYIDTSFLIWLTSLGKDARKEFLGWIDKFGPRTVHIPVWSGHEFLTHHVRDLIGESLSRTSADLAKIADNTYVTLRPFLDEPVDERTPQEFQISARETLMQLKRLAANMSRWKARHYQSHFKEVAEFIAKYGLEGKSVFGFMSDIDVQERNRYAGRIPPGFQDKNKKDRLIRDDDESVAVGSNRYGDLMFWREVLAHAATVDTNAIVILSNDRKNDWYLRGERDFEIDPDLRSVRRSWTPVPLIHPMLALEASVVAEVESVLLMDSTYLAAFFRKSGIPSNKFVDAALTIELPEFENANKARRKIKTRTTEAATASLATDRPSALQDGPAVGIGSIGLERASLTNADRPLVTSFLRDTLENNADGRHVAEFVTYPLLQEATTTDLVQIGKRLHAKAVAGEALATTVLADLVSCLPDLPQKSATCIYLGVLWSVYFDEQNQIRLPPATVALELLIRFRSEEFAAPALEVLQKRMQRQPRRPVYFLTSDLKPVTLEIIVGTESDRSPPAITGLQINAIELLTPAQGETALQLKTLLESRRPASIRDIAGVACRLFGIPFLRLGTNPTLERLVDYDNETGFEVPSTVFIS